MVMKISGANIEMPDGDKATSVVGTVSQASGIPTGAIIERGNSGNDHWVKYADGTAFAWRTATVENLVVNAGASTFINTATRGVSPITFVSGTVVMNAKLTMYTGQNATGDRIYVAPFESLLNSFAFLNTGNLPKSVHPSFTIGTNNAASVVYDITWVGRWF